jgi:SAM-dependent methyltransferase
VTHSSTRYWDSLGAEWGGSNKDRLWRAHSDAVNRSLFSRWLADDPVRRMLKTDLFDEAVGDGLDALLRGHAGTVVGMDIAPETLRAARAGGAQCVPTAADVRALPFASGTFDVIVSNSTLDHFPTLEGVLGALAEFRRVLRDGGHLLLTLDNLANPVVALRSILPFRVLRRMNILSYYVGVTLGPRRLRRMLCRAGFDVQEMATVMHCPRVFCVWKARRLQRRASAQEQEAYRAALMRYERLARSPTRFLTGYFVAVRAEAARVAGSSGEHAGTQPRSRCRASMGRALCRQGKRRRQVDGHGERIW